MDFLCLYKEEKLFPFASQKEKKGGENILLLWDVDGKDAGLLP